MNEYLSRRLVFAGPHEDVRGWKVTFAVGRIVVSIAETRWTQGMELMAWGLFRHPVGNLTPERVEKILRKIWERSAR